MSTPTAGRQAGSLLLRRIRTGTSGADVYLLRQPDGSTVATKVTRTARVSAAAQAQRRDLLAGHLPHRTPRVLATAAGDDLDIIVTAAPATRTLGELIDEAGLKPELVAIWGSVVVELVAMWQRTAAAGFDPAQATRNHERRCQRGLEGLDYALGPTLGSPASWTRIVLNGEDVGAWPDLVLHLHQLGRPAVHVTCHGDPHAGNLLVDATNRWHLIDWEWTGQHHDWRQMVSHLVGGWYIRDLMDTAAGTIQATPSGLYIDWQVGDLERLHVLGRPAAVAFSQMTTAGTVDDDRADVGRHLALLLLRELPRAAQQQSRRHLVAPLLGECLRLLTPQCAAHPALRLLTGAPTAAVTQ